MAGARNSKRDMQELREAKRKAHEVSQHIEAAGVMDDDEPDEGKSLLIGDAVKALGNGKVGGYLVRFSTPEEPDLTGDYFTKDTYFGCITSTNILYHHGQDPSVKARSIGSGTLRKDGVGVWIEAQLRLADDYEKAIYEMVKAGKLRWSSGTAPHLVEREPVGGKAMWIKSWPLGLDASLTPTPAEPRNAAVAIKGETFMDDDTENTTTNTGAAGGGTAPAAPDRVGELEATVKAMAYQQQQLDEQFAKFMQIVDSAPVQKLGYVTSDGGTKDKEVKSLGDFAAAVWRNDVKRLTDVYAVKLNERDGAAGGFTVPPQFETNIMRVAVEQAVVRPRAAVRNITGREILFTAPDYSVAYSRGSSTALAGMQMTWVAEQGTLTDTQVKFRQITSVTHKIGGTIPISNELVRDSALVLEQEITGMFGDAVAFAEDWHFLNGNGAGQPLGVYGAGCLITTASTLTTTAVKLSEILTMMKRLAPECFANAVWVINPMLVDALYAMNSETAGSVPLTPDVSRKGGNLLQSIPVYTSEKVPETFAAGGLLLADFSQYYVVDSGGIQIALSDHVYFNSDQVGLRVTKRIDGQPRWNAARAVGSATSSTVSPFVQSK